MNEQNPFKEIETELKLPEELKEDILQEITETVEEKKETSEN